MLTLFFLFTCAEEEDCLSWGKGQSAQMTSKSEIG